MTTLDLMMKSRESPADVAARILSNSSYLAIRYVNCTFQKGVLTLGGRLPSFHLKQLAQTAVQDIEGVLQVENRIEVTD